MSQKLTPKLKKQLNSLAWQYGRNHEEREEIRGWCMEAAWRATGSLSLSYPDPDGYIYRAMENAACDYARRGPGKNTRRNHFQLSQKDELIVDQRASEDFSSIEQEGILECLMERLEEQDRLMLRLLLEGCSSEDIGRALNPERPLRPNSVRTLLSRKRKEWQALLSEL